MRKSKIVEEPTIKRGIPRWKCQTCQTWVKEDMAIRCAACRKTYGGHATSSTAGAVPRTTVPETPRSTTTKKTPKMFSDLGDMFGH